MKLQFTFFEVLLSLQVILFLVLLFALQLNGSIISSGHASASLRKNLMVYDLVSQLQNNLSLKTCIFQNDEGCTLRVITIYQKTFQLQSIGLKVGNLSFGSFTPAEILNCLVLRSATSSKLLCISVGD